MIDELREIRRYARFVAINASAFHTYGIPAEQASIPEVIIKHEKYLRNFEIIDRQRDFVIARAGALKLKAYLPRYKSTLKIPPKDLKDMSWRINGIDVVYPEVLSLLSFGSVPFSLIQELHRSYPLKRSLIYEIAELYGMEHTARDITNLLSLYTL